MPKTRHVPTAIALVCAALLLGALTWRVQGANGSLASDIYWADLMHALRSERLSAFMLTLNALQGKLVAACIILWMAALARRRQWGALLLLAVTLPGGMLANIGLKMLVQRPRPALPAAVGSHGFAYPSGHVVAITLLCGCLVLETFRRTPKASWRLAASIAALASVALVAASRVYLGMHQSSDVVAAFLLAVVWLGLCMLGAQALGASGQCALQPPAAGPEALRRSITIR